MQVPLSVRLMGPPAATHQEAPYFERIRNMAADDRRPPDFTREYVAIYWGRRRQSYAEQRRSKSGLRRQPLGARSKLQIAAAI